MLRNIWKPAANLFLIITTAVILASCAHNGTDNTIYQPSEDRSSEPVRRGSF